MLYFLKNVLFDRVTLENDIESHLPVTDIYTLFVRIHYTQTVSSIASLHFEEMKLLIRKSKCVISFALCRMQVLADA